mmetsp:Transcript_14724/g.30846  ORF Transcript_14724/g.30846 Transcript_14724/m.30846 type:complete len:104 (+) Transcript_14724:677-988(+)
MVIIPRKKTKHIASSIRSFTIRPYAIAPRDDFLHGVFVFVHDDTGLPLFLCRHGLFGGDGDVHVVVFVHVRGRRDAFGEDIDGGEGGDESWRWMDWERSPIAG